MSLQCTQLLEKSSSMNGWYPTLSHTQCTYAYNYTYMDIHAYTITYIRVCTYTHIQECTYNFTHTHTPTYSWVKNLKNVWPLYFSPKANYPNGASKWVLSQVFPITLLKHLTHISPTYTYTYTHVHTRIHSRLHEYTYYTENWQTASTCVYNLQIVNQVTHY